MKELFGYYCDFPLICTPKWVIVSAPTYLDCARFNEQLKCACLSRFPELKVKNPIQKIERILKKISVKQREAVSLIFNQSLDEAVILMEEFKKYGVGVFSYFEAKKEVDKINDFNN